MAQARWLSWLEHHPILQKAEVSVPDQGTCLGCGFDLQSGHILKAMSLSLSLSLSLSFFLCLTSSLSKIQHILG